MSLVDGYPEIDQPLHLGRPGPGMTTQRFDAGVRIITLGKGLKKQKGKGDSQERQRLLKSIPPL